MMRVVFSGKAAAMVLVVAMSALLAGCGDDSDSAATTEAVSATPASNSIDRSGSSSTPTTTVAGMQINGSPAATATVGQPYSFQPTVAGAAGTSLQFSITNTPAWAKFDPTTGAVTGTPTASQVGTYKGIAISVSAGTVTATLPAFSIVVSDGGSQSNVTLSWDAPTQNADGTTLMDLKGYKVHYGAASKVYSDTIQVTNPGLTTYVVQNLPVGTYYFAITAYNSAGQESPLSPEISTQVN